MPKAGRLHYLEALPPPGQRTAGTLVLIHAFPLHARMWAPQLTLAAHGWRVIAPDLRGFGESEAGTPAASMDDYAADVIDLLDRLRIDRAVFAGLSMGGYVTFALLRLAARYVQGLILADTRAEADTPQGIGGRNQMLELVRERGAAAVAEQMVPKLLGATTVRTRPELTDLVRALILSASPASIGQALVALRDRPDSTPLLSSVHCPSLIVVGADDVVTPPDAAERMHRGLAGSTLITIPDAGHLSNLEQPLVFNDAVARFLEHQL